MATRRERVVLDVESNAASVFARDAAAAKLLANTLDSLGGSGARMRTATRTIASDTDALGMSAGNADRSINQLTGRLRLFADIAAILGPGLAPITTVGIPGVTGLANQMGVAALAGGAMIASFQGVGDALKAVEQARLDPTVANLEKAQTALDNLSPAARDLVARFQELRPVLRELRDAGAENMFPGFIEGIDALESRADDFERIMSTIAEATGDIFADTGASFASERWDEFFSYLETEAPQTLTALAQTVGALTHGVGELMMAFDPLNDDFNSWLLGIAQGFDRWAAGLDQTKGFQEFVEYVRANGPQVQETFVALADAVLEIGEAAAPLGGPVLAGLEAVARVISAIADSPLGTPIMTAVGALALLNRTLALTDAAMARLGRGGAAGGAFATIQTRASQARGHVTGLSRDVGVMATTWATAGARSEREARRVAASTERVRTAASNLGKGAAGIGALTLATSGLGDQMGITHTATGALMGMVAGPWGAAIGAGVGAVMDLSAALDDSDEKMQAFFQVAHAQAGGDIAAEIDIVTAKLEEQKRIMDDGTFLGFRWQQSDAGEAAENIDDLTARLKDLRTEQQLAAIESGDLLPGWGMIGSAANSVVKDILDVAAAGRDAADGLDATGRALARLNDFLTGRANIRDYQQALDDFTASLRENGKTFDVNSQRGRDNQAALDGVAASALKVTEKMSKANRIKFLAGTVRDIQRVAEQMGLPAAATQKVIDKLNLARATAMGMTAAQKQLIRQYHLTPEQVQTLVRQIGMGKSQADIRDLLRQYGLTPREVRTFLRAIDQASGAIAGVRAGLNSLHDKTITINVRRRGATTGSGTLLQADGGVVDFYANGGIRHRENHVAQIAPAGAWRVWAEPETGGEAYIPLAPAKWPRSRPVLEETARRLGGEVSWNADGGLYERRAAAVRGAWDPFTSTAAAAPATVDRSVTVRTGPVTTVDPKAAARELEQRIRDAVSLAGTP